MSEVETKTLRKYVAVIGGILVEQVAKGEPGAIREVAKGDTSNSAFARGLILGVKSVLDCGGIPAFLTGDEAAHLKSRILGLVRKFKILETLEARDGAAEKEIPHV